MYTPGSDDAQIFLTWKENLGTYIIYKCATEMNYSY